MPCRNGSCSWNSPAWPAPPRAAPGKELEVILLLARSEPVLAGAFGADQFALFCTPAVNLFPRRSDRVNLTEREAEHHVVPDRMRPLDFEVFSVQQVEGFAADGSGAQPFMPFYAANDLSRQPGAPRLLHPAARAAAAVLQRPPARPALELSTATRCSSRWWIAEAAPLRARAAPARARSVVHQPRPAAGDAGRQAAHRLHHRGQRPGRRDPLPGRPDRAAPVPRRRRIRLAVHQPSRPQLPQPDRYRRAPGGGGAARVAAALSAARRPRCRRGSSRG